MKLVVLSWSCDVNMALNTKITKKQQLKFKEK